MHFVAMPQFLQPCTIGDTHTATAKPGAAQTSQLNFSRLIIHWLHNWRIFLHVYLIQDVLVEPGLAAALLWAAAMK